MNLNEQLFRIKELIGIKPINETINEDKLTRYFQGSEELDEDEVYNTSFDIKELVKITTFKERVNYCNQTLKYIAQGSSRRVYDLPDGKHVLKLAKNKKGIAQNEEEYDIGSYPIDIIAKVNYTDMLDDNILFVVMEKAEKISEQDFLKLSGFRLDEFNDICNSKGEYEIFNKFDKYKLDNEIKQSFRDNVLDYIVSSGLDVYGDLKVLNHWGKVIRDGQPQIVLIDYGLTNDVAKSYYSM